MNRVLKEIQQHAELLPLAQQAELLNYTIYLEYKAHRGTETTDEAAQRQDAEAWNNLMLAQAHSLTDWDNDDDEVWNDVPAI